MTGNFLSRAVMSIFMDKRAREKYSAIQDVKRSVRDGKPVPPPEPVNDEADDALDALPESLIQEAIAAAGAELDRKKNLPPGRQALIEQALDVQDRQRKLLDDLPKEQREKLIVMAMHAFGDDMEAQKGAKKTKRKKS